MIYLHELSKGTCGILDDISEHVKHLLLYGWKQVVREIFQQLGTCTSTILGISLLNLNKFIRSLLIGFIMLRFLWNCSLNLLITLVKKMLSTQYKKIAKGWFLFFA